MTARFRMAATIAIVLGAALILANVEQVVNDAMTGSPLLQSKVDTGQLGVVGAYYELVSGRVAFSEMIGRAAATAPTPVAAEHGR